MSLDVRLSPQIDIEHPWLGLESFGESARAYFFGRDAEAAELIRRLRLHPLLVLYGLSGLGKTSLLRAKLLPGLESLGDQPAFHRIGYRKGEDSPLDQLLVALKADQRIHIPGLELPEDAASRLWLHLHSRDERSRITHLILDQFEEIFTLGAERPRADAEVRQALAILVQGAIPPPVENLLDEREALLKYFHLDVPPLPVLLSLRQEYVFALNRWQNQLALLGQNNFELHPLRGPTAFDAVFKPGELRCLYRGEVREENKVDTGLRPIISQETARRIVHFAAKAKDDVLPEEIEVVPPILSLLCQELNEDRFTKHASVPGEPANQISFQEGETDVETIFGNFYDRCLSGRPEAVRVFIDEKLVSPYSGARLQQDKRSILKVFTEGCEIPGATDDRRAAGYGNPTAAQACLEELVNQRLLTVLGGDENPGYELVHDLLAAVVEKSRSVRHERLEKERLERQSKKAEEEQKRISDVLSQANVSLARYSKDFGKSAQALAHLAQALRLNPGNAAAAKLTGAILTQAGWPILFAGPMRHGRAVYSAQFSPDGQQVVTASEDKTARLWDALDGKSIGETMRHEDTVHSAHFSPDGQRVVTASEKTARLWDALRGKPIGEPMHHEGTVYSAKFSPDGQRVVTASGDKTARLWDAFSGKVRGEPLRHEDTVYSAQFSPDGHWVVSASKDKTARLWDALTGKSRGEPLRHEDTVYAAQFSPDSQRVVSASEDKTARLWDALSGKSIGEPMQHGHTVRSAQFSPDGQRVVTASMNSARLWDALSGKAIGEPMQHGARVYSERFSSDGQRVVTASADRTARLWDALSGKPIGEPMQHEETVYSAEFDPDGQYVLTASLDKTARLWDALSAKPIGGPLWHEDTVTSAQFSPDGKRVVTASGDNAVRLRDVLSGKSIGELMQHEGGVTSVQFSPDGQRVVTASLDKTARLWDALSGKPVGEPIQHSDAVVFAQFSPDGQRILSASADNAVRLWDVLGGKPVGEPMKHKATVYSAQFSPDGQRVVTAAGDNTVRLWDASSGESVGLHIRHAEKVDSAQFSLDGRRVLTASGDNAVRLWDVLSGKPIGEPMQHGAKILFAQFGPDDQRILTASGNNAVQLWDALSGRPIGRPMQHGARVYSAQFSPNGQQVVTACGDNAVRFWDVPSGKPIGEPMQYRARVYSAQFSPDGQRVVTSSVDTTGLWDFSTITNEDSVEDVLMLADLAEATGGIALQTTEQEETQHSLISEEIRARRDKIAAVFTRPSCGLTPLQRLLKWGVSDSKHRTISPTSQLTVAEWIEYTINDGSLEGLRSAMQVDPANARLAAHLSKRLAEQALKEETAPAAAQRANAEADFQARRALKLAPENEEVKALCTGLAMRSLSG